VLEKPGYNKLEIKARPQEEEKEAESYYKDKGFKIKIQK
jgi:hypothetical protein